jgi:threonine dehydratase
MKITSQQIEEAAKRLNGVATRTPLQLSKRLSKKYGANVYIKREDMQEVRSFKIRGAFNKISSLTEEERKRGVVCASAGNHAQGVAYSCSTLKIRGTIFMPEITPNQKIEKVRHFGAEYVEIKLVGHTYDDASVAAHTYCKENGAVYVHPFNDPMTIAGQGTIGKEIYEDLDDTDNLVVITAIGGGGLVSGISSYLKEKDANIKIIAAEPEGAPAMYEALKQKKVVLLDKIDTFVDGAAVGCVGENTFEICKRNVEKVLLVPEGLICSVMIDLYQNEGIW